MFKRVVLPVGLVLLLLTACGTKATKPELKYSVPSDCQSTKILAALPASIPNPAWIDTKWQPAEGTDLYNAINSGGIACTYGNQQAEIGTTVMWAPSEPKVFDEMAKKWSAAGQTKIDIPGVKESSAYWSGNEATGADNMHTWSINILYKYNWIQVNGSFIYSMDDALPIIKAAIGSLVNG